MKASKAPADSRSLKRLIRAPLLATLKRDIDGAYTHWKKGEVVKVLDTISRGKCCIEKLKRKPSGILKEGLPLINQMAGVPLRVLKFHECSNDKLRERTPAP